ncbi:MAG: hypothetical protein JWP55_3843 [Mycobacterium sp.]|nr:hypothetical protein [Mycobacterium sp.]
MGRDSWSRFAVIALVVIVVRIDQRHAGAELGRTLGRFDTAGRPRVGPDVHAGHVRSNRVQFAHVHPVDFNGIDDYLGTTRRGGEHGRCPLQ